MKPFLITLLLVMASSCAKRVPAAPGPPVFRPGYIYQQVAPGEYGLLVAGTRELKLGTEEICAAQPCVVEFEGELYTVRTLGKK